MLQIFGQVSPPPGVSKWGGLINSFSGSAPTATGLIGFLNALLRLMIVVGAIWALVNIILAGYKFLAAGGKPEDIGQAWAKLWQTLIGLLFIAGAFVLAAIFGQIIFGDSTAIIVPKIITK